MKKTTLFTLTLLFSFGFLLKQGLAQDPASRGEAVSIPDPNLRFYIALELGKAEAASITVAEMETLTEFSADDRSVKDLTGIEFATNLTHLFLGGNQISDISLLAHLTNLTWLDLDDNQISDVSPLVGLSNLTHLSLSSNQISDVSPLTNLINLKTLYVDDNQISDVSPLAKLTNLKKLFLDINQISDVSPLAKLTNLTELGLSSNQISDVSPLAKLTNLTVLNLQSNQISDFSPTDRLKPNLVIYIKNLQQVNGKVVESEQPDVEIDDVIDDGLPPDHIDPSHLDEAHPEDAGGDFTLDAIFPVHIPDPNLRTAIEKGLGKTSGATISYADIRKLTDLRANKQGIQDLTGLEFAANLTQLRLSNNQISDISVLAGLTKLTELYLAGNQISDVSPLAGLTKLTKLILSSNQISDFSSTDRLKPNLVTYKKDLQRVGGPDDVVDDGLPPDHIIPDPNLRTAIEKGLGKTSGATISYADIRKLTDLRANKQDIQDLTGLEFATNLTQARLSNNQISDISVLAELTKLTELYLAGNQISDVSPLAGLTKLTKLILSSNQISDFSSTDRLKPNLVTYKKDLQRVGGPDDVIDDGLPPDHIDPSHLDEAHPEDAGGDFTLDAIFPVHIPDSNLRTAIEKGLGKISGATISYADIRKLTDLRANKQGIQDLTGLEFATNLTQARLSNNQISDISVLAELTKLTELYLAGNQISDVSPLAGLTKLTKLILSSNQISDFSSTDRLKPNLVTYKKDLQRVGGPDDVIDDGLPPDHIDPSHLDEAHPEDAGGDFTSEGLIPVQAASLGSETLTSINPKDLHFNNQISYLRPGARPGIEDHSYSNEFYSVSWSPDGKRLASGGGALDVGAPEGPSWPIQIWNPHAEKYTEQLLHFLEGHTGNIYSVSWSPDGELLASGSADKTIRIWNSHTGEHLRTLKGHLPVKEEKERGFIYALHALWSPDGTLLASGGSDNTIRIWNPYTGENLRTLKGHLPIGDDGYTSYPINVSWSPDGTLLASGGSDDTIRIWNPRNGQPLRTFEADPDPASSWFSGDSCLCIMESGWEKARRQIIS